MGDCRGVADRGRIPIPRCADRSKNEARELMQIDLERFASWVQPEDILIDVEVRNATHALGLIADAAAQRHGLEPDPVFRALARREAAGSTGVGGGFAIPHAKIVGLAHPLTVLLRPTQAIPFRAPDGAPVSLMLAILVPFDGDKDTHLKLLALVAELFSNATFRSEIEAAKDTAAIAAAFRAKVASLTNAGA